MEEPALERGEAHISMRKPSYPLTSSLLKYLKEFDRKTRIPCHYQDLLRFSNAIPLLDKQGKDTLWETVFYNDYEQQELHSGLTKIYAILKNAGDVSVMEHLRVDRIDYCIFGNSKPFRVKIINSFNDNYDYFYVKLGDSSRIYGLELEHILSPNRINYLVDHETLIEEHIAGIPGDQFITTHFKDPQMNETRLAKEFVKFNERCFVKLLGDMRAYNFVVDITPDFDDLQYRIRAIDFDQQCHEGRMNIYRPQFFKENFEFVQLCIKRLNQKTVRQYQSEECSLIAGRIHTSRYRLKALMDIMVKAEISTNEKIYQLKHELTAHYHDDRFLACQTMGEIVKQSLYIVMQSH